MLERVLDCQYMAITNMGEVIYIIYGHFKGRIIAIRIEY